MELRGAYDVARIQFPGIANLIESKLMEAIHTMQNITSQAFLILRGAPTDSRDEIGTASLSSRLNREFDGNRMNGSHIRHERWEAPSSRMA
jgi:hypothetical protein